ncbi:MAG: polysaccharide biosynthesis tyrosine autokinase [Nitrococcus sp.]|nr:polysaccharide biosynthesis tyrosine autokinase [Nitrococcus sp.]
MKDDAPLQAVRQVVPQPLNRTEASEAAGMDLLEILAILLDAKWWILSITTGVVLLAALYAFTATPIYQANVIIQIQEDDINKQSSRLNATPDGLFVTTAPTEAEVNIMTSRAVVMPVVKKLHLNIAVGRDCPPVIGCLFARDDSVSATVTRFETQSYLQPFTLRAGANHTYALYSKDGDRVLTGTVGKLAVSDNGQTELYVQALSAPAGTSFTLTKIPVQLKATTLGARLSAAQLGEETGVVELTLNGSAPVRIKEILNAVADQYLKLNIAAKSAQARESLEFITGQLPGLKAKLNAAETALSDYRVKYGAVDLGLQAKSLLSRAAQLHDQLSQLKLKEAELAQRYDPKFRTYAALLEQKKRIKAQLSALEAQINHLPMQQQKNAQLKRAVMVYDELYTAMLRKAQDLRVAQAGTLGNVRIVDHAVTPIRPIKPKNELVIAMGLMMGLTLGALAAFAKRIMAVGIRDPASLESAFRVPLFAVVPHSKTQAAIDRKARKARSKQLPLLVRAQKNDLAVEAMRSLRTSLHSVTQGLERSVLTIGGASPGPGKSFLSANLAHLIAQAGKRVLLVDADLRKGHLNDYFGISRTPGLAEILSGQAQLGEVVDASSEPGLDFVATGSLPTYPSELFLTPRFEKFIAEASGKYHVVLLDIPPYLAVSDGFIVARNASANFLLVQNARNTQEEIALVINRLQQNAVRLTGFIYNDFGYDASGYAYRGYGARYHYRYE